MAKETTTVIYILPSFCTVPAILSGPMNMTLEYSYILTASFTCTAFGGSEAEIAFLWDIVDLYSDVDINSIVETLNSDNSTTSTVTTNILVENIVIFKAVCCVAFNISIPFGDHCASAFIQIGKRST